MAIPDAFRPLGRMVSTSNGNSFPVFVATPFTLIQIDSDYYNIQVSGNEFFHFKVSYNTSCPQFRLDGTPRLLMVTLNNLGGANGFEVYGPGLAYLWTVAESGVHTLIYHDGKGGIFNLSNPVS